MTSSWSISSAPGALDNPTREPRVLFYDDGRHAASLYQFEPPVRPEDHTVIVDQLAKSGVDTLIYSAGVEGGVVQYDSKVAQRWGDNVQTWKHPVWYRAARVLHQLIADGHDPLKLLCDRCHNKGLWFIPSLFVGVVGGERRLDGGFGRKSDFVYDNPQFQVGDDGDPRAKALLRERFSFLHAEVRAERFKLFHELLSGYETDGVELDLANPDNLGPLCRFSQTGQLAPVLSRWIADVRAAARKAEDLQQRRKRVYVRIPAHPAGWEVLGYEVETWMQSKFVDGIICVTNDPEMHDQDIDLTRAVERARGTGCRVFGSCNSVIGPGPVRYASAPMIWAAAANAYHQGADGFGLGDPHWSPHGWPWVQDEYQTLRLLGQPDQLATASKVYRVRSSPGKGILPGAAPPLPRTVSAAEPVELELRVADELIRWHALGILESARLRVRVANIDAATGNIAVELNGRQLPPEKRRLNDLTYRVRRLGSAGPYGYAFEYELDPEHYPRPGVNRVRVIVTKEDPLLGIPLQVHEVDFSVQYRLHRHFERIPLDY